MIQQATTDCSHRPPCPGCPRFGSASVAPNELSALKALAQAQGIADPAVIAGVPWGYRHRARLAVRGRARSPKLGIFREGTHQVVDIPHCPVHHPRINEVAGLIKAALRALGAAPYSDTAHAGLVRYVQIAIERESQLAQVVLVTARSHYDAESAALCEGLRQHLGAHLQGLFWNGHPEPDNAVLGPHWHRVAGAPATCELLGGAQTFFPPGAFGQSNLPLYEQIVQQIHSWALGAHNAVELYAGTGAIGLGLALTGTQVMFNELESASLDGLRMGIAALPESVQARVSVFPGSAGDVADTALSHKPDWVLADPPRKGLDSGVVKALLSRKPHRFLYLSCGLPAFLRDAEMLIQGPYRLSALQAYALFPFTHHVESLALFETR